MNRQPEGIPTGGQFAASAKSEPDVTLLFDRFSSKDGRDLPDIDTNFAQPSEDDWAFARETLGEHASHAEISDLAHERFERDAREFAERRASARVSEAETNSAIDIKAYWANRAQSLSGPAAVYAYAREWVAAEELALRADPSLVDDYDRIDDACGKMLRRSSDEIRDLPAGTFPVLTQEQTNKISARFASKLATRGYTRDLPIDGHRADQKAVFDGSITAIASLHSGAATVAEREALEKTIRERTDFSSGDVVGSVNAAVRDHYDAL